MFIWKSLGQVARALGCSTDRDQALSFAAVDSRLVQPGTLFFALPGKITDGHQFLEQAAEAGAVAAIVSCGYQGPSYSLELIKVKEPFEALQQLAKEAMTQFKGKVIGVTGSLGKTTVKEFLYTLLSQKFTVAKTPANYNSQIGLPLTVLNTINGDEDFAVLEMAMTRAGEITKLVNMAPPHVAIITKIALVHAENFEGIEGIAHAKGEILCHPRTELAIVPEDFIQIGTCTRIHPDLDFHSKAFSLNGKHHEYNMQIAVTCAKHVGMSNKEIEETLPLLKLPERRCESVVLNGITFVNDSYNAAVPSIEAAMETLPLPQGQGKRIAVLSALAELGSFTKECHEQVAEISLKYVDHLICVGESCDEMVKRWKCANKPVIQCKDRTEVVAQLKQLAQSGDVVLLKGSNKNQLWKVLEEV